MPPKTELLTVALPAPQTFVCPGENYEITAAVHLSRLAAFYPKCRDCPSRTETGQLSPNTLERLHSTEHRIQRKSLFLAEGIRGVYLNELNSTRAGEIAGALASLLWEQSPLVGEDPAAVDASMTKPQRHKHAGPVVVVGQDERPSSIDIVTGIAKVLRRMGCHVIDIGLSTRPSFWFAVGHLKATAGIHVTGSGCPPAWTGLDLVGAGAIPFSQDLMLDKIEARLAQGFSRPLRQSAGQRTYHGAALYESGLNEHFHALRPLRVACGCPNAPVRAIIERMFQNLACKLQPVAIPSRSRQLADPADADALRISRAVREGQAHFGILIDDDGQSCALFDERGELISAPKLTLVLARMVLDEHPGGVIVVEEPAADELTAPIESAGGRCQPARATLSAVAQALAEQTAQFGGGTSGRYWFRTDFPMCDAVLTLAKVMQSLSRSDADFSEVVQAAA